MAIFDDNQSENVQKHTKFRRRTHIIEHRALLSFQCHSNHPFLKKQQDEKFFGGGQQYINLDLNGHVTPLLVQDKVVGNNILTNLIGKYTSKEITYWPAPIFTSNKKYWMSLEATELLILDMSQDEFFEIEIFAENSNSIFFSQQFDNYGLLMNDMSSKLGRKEDIPDWIVEGSVIGLQGGSEIVMDRYREGRRKGAEITGVWIQDWSGQVNTGFGDRVNWNWEWNETYYPTLREDVEELKKDGAYFLVYMNPHLLQNSSTFNSAQHANVLIKQRDDPSKPIIQGFGSGFDCGTVDLTTEKGRNWYKTEIIFKALDLGIRGWMADFGEYVPLDKSEIILDCELEENSECSAENVHNEFPTLYAQVNFDAVNEYRKVGEIDEIYESNLSHMTDSIYFQFRFFIFYKSLAISSPSSNASFMTMVGALDLVSSGIVKLLLLMMLAFLATPFLIDSLL